MTFSSWSKFWVVVTLCSLLVYVLYWLSATFNTIYTYILDGITPSRFLSVYLISDVLVPAVGVVLRFVGVSLALVLVYLVWSSKSRSFLREKKKVAVAVFFEGVYLNN